MVWNSVDAEEKSLLLDLPFEVLLKSLRYVTFDELCRIRLVCKVFNSCSQRLLNEGFKKAESSQNQLIQRVKSQLPRRESERRRHPFARYADVLTAVETRLSLLSMTFKKYLDLGLCCFIPGRVLDEVFNVLINVRNHLDGNVQGELKPHEILQELRDISSMAMEHFDEHIMPRLKNNVIDSTIPRLLPHEYLANAASLAKMSGHHGSSMIFGFAGSSVADYNNGNNWTSARQAAATFSTSSPSTSGSAISNGLVNFSVQFTKLDKQYKTLTQENAQMRIKLNGLAKSNKRLKQENQEQSRLMIEQGNKMDEMACKLLEIESRFGDLSSELGHSNPIGKLSGSRCAANVTDRVSSSKKRKLVESACFDAQTSSTDSKMNKLVADESPFRVTRKSVRLLAKKLDD